MAPTILLTLSFFSPQVEAFAPSDSIHIGSEPTRILRTHQAHQYRLRKAESWQSFVRGEGKGWMARFDERTGTAHRAWGPGIALEDLSNERAVERSLRAVLERNPLLVGVDQEDLQLSHIGYIQRTDTWYVQFQRHENGIPVLYGGVTARIRFGKLILLGIDTYPQASGVGTRPEVNKWVAQEIAIEKGPADLAEHTELSQRLVLLPQEGSFGLGFRLAWETRSRTQSPIGIWVSHIDAFSGELINVYNDIRFFLYQMSNQF